MTKYVYLFKEGNANMRELLGGKGANLAEMTNLGMPVPQGFTVTTDAVGNFNLRCCRRYFYKSVFHIVLFGLRLKIRNCLSFRRPFFLSRLKYRQKLFPS